MAKTFSYMGSRQMRGGPSAANSLTADFRASMADILANLDRWVDGMKEQAPGILVEALEPTFGLALEYTPVDTHELRSSGYLEAESFRGGARAVIGFGKGGSPDYAIYVHEMPYAHEAPTRSKFLQSALDEDYGAIYGRVRKLVKQASGT